MKNCGELEVGNRLFQESRARYGQEIEESRRIFFEETSRVRQVRIDELIVNATGEESRQSESALELSSGFAEQGDFLDRRKRILRSPKPAFL